MIKTISREIPVTIREHANNTGYSKCIFVPISYRVETLHNETKYHYSRNHAYSYVLYGTIKKNNTIYEIYRPQITCAFVTDGIYRTYWLPKTHFLYGNIYYKKKGNRTGNYCYKDDLINKIGVSYNDINIINDLAELDGFINRGTKKINNIECSILD